MNMPNISPLHQHMLDGLKRRGQNWGYAKLGTAVIAVGPGVPFGVKATDFYAKDIDAAVAAGVLESNVTSGSFSFERFLAAK